jgi:hypothetical protein
MNENKWDTFKQCSIYFCVGCILNKLLQFSINYHFLLYNCGIIWFSVSEGELFMKQDTALLIIDGWEIHPSIAPREEDIIIQKYTQDSFHETNPSTRT